MLKRNFTVPVAAMMALLGLSAPASAANNAISEFRLGVYAHDSKLFGTGHETRKPDINAELLFSSPGWLSWIGAPRPAIGGNFNTHGGTSIAYADLAWDYYLTQALFLEGALGGAIHNGNTSGDNNKDRDRMNYGCRAAFHEAGSVGYSFDGKSSLMLTVDHISNAGLCDRNPGLTDIGVRYGYRF
ncbi:MAG: acyloxyacyl hydrolase [Parvibaculaceae bacterium]|nr:acyloxyacyl hydrolase [Parvibaculaceae bacterium]